MGAGRGDRLRGDRLQLSGQAAATRVLGLKCNGGDLQMEPGCYEAGAGGRRLEQEGLFLPAEPRRRVFLRKHWKGSPKLSERWAHYWEEQREGNPSIPLSGGGIGGGPA